ncbi:MAG TPA: hypothetical protein VK989_19265 [Polyangia bacterium]|jgi:hypothetical protein|nr:hypothetical protein [Polyangia bacterium]
MAWDGVLRGARLGITLGAALIALGCDGGGRPDTGFGGDAAVPATINCTDFCQRSADCFVDLCDEDTSSTRYAGGEVLVEQSCLSTCTDPRLQAAATQASWNCLFQSTCRQAFGEDVCHENGRYSCE